MRDDRAPYRTAFPQLVSGAMFILPLAAACYGPIGAVHGQRTRPEPAVAPGQGAETFTVQFQDTDIAQALQMLSIQGQRNIVTGKNVGGSVSANLFDVTVLEALDVILKANDLRYEEVGNFIYVYTRDEWEQMQNARRKRESRRFVLEYIAGKDANEFVVPLLSDQGKIGVVGTTERGVQPDLGNVGEDSWAFQSMLVVNDYPENLASIAELLAEIDTPPTQVSVESTIVSTRVNEDNAWGVDFTIIADVSFVDFTNPLSVVNNLIKGNNNPGDKATEDKGFQPADNRAGAVGSNVGQVQRPGGFKAGIISENASVFLRVLDEVTDVMILARPRVLALNRQRAQILVGERVGYLSTTQTETAATQTVKYLDTGIKLVFRPFISRDGSIRMELAPSVSEAILRQVTDRLGGGVVIPDEKTNEITTNIRVRDGQTIVLGGLFQEKTTVSRRQVPWAGDIPILGAAFKGQDDKVERNEIIFLVTPTIMNDTIAAAWSEAGNEFAEAVRVGAREGLLPFSREAMSANLNREALDALNRGDSELALYYTENSLRINKNQPEMVILRHELDRTKPDTVFERDMMKRIMSKRMTAADAKAATIAAATAVPNTDPLAPATPAAAAPETPVGEVATDAAPTATAMTDEMNGDANTTFDEFGGFVFEVSFPQSSEVTTDATTESATPAPWTSPLTDVGFDGPTTNETSGFASSPLSAAPVEGNDVTYVESSNLLAWYARQTYALPWMKYFVGTRDGSLVATPTSTSSPE